MDSKNLTLSEELAENEDSCKNFSDKSNKTETSPNPYVFSPGLDWPESLLENARSKKETLCPENNPENIREDDSKNDSEEDQLKECKPIIGNYGFLLIAFYIPALILLSNLINHTFDVLNQPYLDTFLNMIWIIFVCNAFSVLVTKFNITIPIIIWITSGVYLFSLHYPMSFEKINLIPCGFIYYLMIWTFFITISSVIYVFGLIFNFNDNWPEL